LGKKGKGAAGVGSEGRKEKKRPDQWVNVWGGMGKKRSSPLQQRKNCRTSPDQEGKHPPKRWSNGTKKNRPSFLEVLVPGKKEWKKKGKGACAECLGGVFWLQYSPMEMSTTHYS